MEASSRSDRRRRVARGIYEQPNGRYTVCVMVDGQPRFRTVTAATIGEAWHQRELLQSLARIGELAVSPRLTFAEVAARWLADFEAKVTAGERRDRTLDLYRSQLSRHLLPRLGRRRLALITADDVVAIMRDLQIARLSPWTIKRISARSAASSPSRCAAVTSRRIPSTTSGRIRSAPTNAFSPKQSSPDSSPPVQDAIGRYSSPAPTWACASPRCSG
jgi:hypothetical protein